MDRDLYPKDWEEISADTRKRSRGRCQCTGQCGVDHTILGAKRCTERQGRKAISFNGQVVLTVAHLCHDPSCINKDHLLAMCQACHLRYDKGHHVATRRRKQEKATGQGHLFIGG